MKQRFLFIFFSVIFSLPLHDAHGATLRGELLAVADSSYLLVRSETGHEVVRVMQGAALGNIATLKQLVKEGGLVEVYWSSEASGVKVADTVTLAPRYRASPAIEIEPTQAATWRDLESGPDRHLMVDVRSREQWEEGRIERSLSIPFDREKSFAVPLPEDRSLGLVFYGEGPDSDLAHRASRAALAAGYQKVRVYSGGLADWRKKGYTTAVSIAGARRMLERGDALLLVDIRARADWDKGHISGSLSAPPGSFTKKVVTVPQKNSFLPLLIAGYANQDGKAALDTANPWGYHTNAPVSYLEGGMEAWQQAGFPLEKDGIPKTAPEIVAEGEITFAEFIRLWKQDQEHASVLLNLRDEDEPPRRGEIHVPFARLVERLRDLPRDRELVLYCYTGTKASIAYHLLKNNGFKVRFLNRNVAIGEKGELVE